MELKIIPTHEFLHPDKGVLMAAIFFIGPIDVQFQAIDTKIHPDLIYSGVRFPKRYFAIININGVTWYWHGTNDVENLKSYHNYLVQQMKLGKRLVIHDIISGRPPIAVSYKGITVEPK